MDYDDLLNRGKSELPESVVSHNRFEVPAAKVIHEGKKSIVTNFGDICSTLIRDPDAVGRYLLRELGTAGSRGEGRLSLNGTFSADDINAVIKKYVESFVMCRECHLPDTRLQKEGRRTFIRCEACGAKYETRVT
jgi:translation initiation factor 2 subunit 2